MRYLSLANLSGILRKNAEPPRPAAPETTVSAPPSEEDYAWITNELLLREEGAVYGLAEKGLEEKCRVIAKYYDREIAELHIRLQASEDRQATIVKELERAQAVLTGYQTERDNFPLEADSVSHELGRVMVGMLAYVLVILSAFCLTYLWLRPQWGGYTALVSLGAYFFGSLSLFSHYPLLLHDQTTVQTQSRREIWKIALEEVGVPLVATLFIIAWGAATVPWWQTLTLCLFLFFSFLFVGRGLLSNILSLKEQLRLYQADRHSRRRHKSRHQELNEHWKQQSVTVAGLKDQLEQQTSLIADLRRQIARAQEEKEARQAYFASEYQLAKQAKSAYAHFFTLQS